MNLESEEVATRSVSFLTCLFASFTSVLSELADRAVWKHSFFLIVDSR